MRHSISRDELLEEIRRALESADDSVRAAWERVRVEPAKWRCSPWGDDRGGFWVVGEMLGEVVWFNDIEGGFNRSSFATRGVIGEYSCNQADFAELLGTLPEATVAEAFAALAAAEGVPAELQGPGRVVRRQTTYWDLQAAAGALVRVHFTHKREVRFAGPDYGRLSIADDHPILNDHRRRWASLFVTGAARCGGGFLPELAERVARATDGWRTADEYLAQGGRGVLDSGYGLLMRAPEDVAGLAAEVTRVFGILPSVLPDPVEPAATAAPRLRALLVDRSFVIAEAFRFARIG